MKIYHILFIFLLIFPASALTITPVDPSLQNPTHVVIEPLTTHKFSYAVAGTGSTTLSSFCLDGVITNISEHYKEYTFDEPGYHNVIVTAYDGATPSNTITYNVVVTREISGDTIETFDEDNFNSVMQNVEEEDWEGIAADSTKPFVYILGRLFYLILFVLPYGLMWMKQQRLTIPVVLSLFLGSLFIGFVPEQYKHVLIGVIVLSYAVNLYLITRER